MAVQKVNGVALKSLQGELTKSFDDVKGQLHKLQATIDSLEGHWAGIGAGAFNAKQTQINNNMVGIGNLLLNFQEAIEAARTIAGNTDDEVEAALRGVDVVDGYSGDPGAEKATSNLNHY
ncbi:WXG100 family type VII secretion target [Streptomyces sp. NPDC087420]|uniref:WXG100 family type VII secretion target n=1 Tax=unclassified Streptomyces TaxID=2593676 RepID=UPI002E14D8CD|nr:WXG100 family type VII secretion target [Streptomyces sp. NBC_01317]